MELELRDKNHNFIFSFKQWMAEFVLKFIITEKNMRATTYESKGKRYKGFVNDSNEIVAGKNDLMEFFIRPGDYIRVKTED